MYQPPQFQEQRAAVLHALIRKHPLGLLISHGPNGLEANPIPFLVEEGGPHGVLRAHLARANPQLETLRQATPVLVVFQGPQAYVSPSWYTSKAEHGRVVPTWNYVVVQARGIPQVHDDAHWLRAQVEALTATQEAARPHPWQVADAPEDFVSAQLRAISGIEIVLTHLEGKWKVSQNRAEADRAGVATALATEGHQALANLVTSRGAEPAD
ncbi:MAG: FMN-binding negative transcriptional regulator [Bryobacterales bacterium]|nr:FMN-binding negative transcriptional regulator [Bryobacterales bacterium]